MLIVIGMNEVMACLNKEKTYSSVSVDSGMLQSLARWLLLIAIGASETLKTSESFMQHTLIIVKVLPRGYAWCTHTG